MRLDLQQIQGGQQILVSRKGAKAQRRCLALLLGSQESLRASRLCVRYVGSADNLFDDDCLRGQCSSRFGVSLEPG